MTEASKAYMDAQEEFLRENPIGTRVRVHRKAESFERGWGAVWSRFMDKRVGTIGTIKRTARHSPACGIAVHFGDDYWLFPYFVLTPLVSKEKQAEQALYAERQCAFAKVVPVGSRVRVWTKAESYESGWGNVWDNNPSAFSMSDSIGGIGTITEYNMHDMVVEFSNGAKFCYPYFVLESVPQRAEEHNRRHLKGMACPACNSYGPFNTRIVATAILSNTEVRDSTVVSLADHELCRCERCKSVATVKRFRLENQ